MFSSVARLLFPLVLGVAVALSAPGAESPPSPVVTAYFSERPPFAVVDGQTGILITLTKAILSEAGIRARFIELPTARILDLLRAGQNDALLVGWYRGTKTTGRQSLPFYQEQAPVALMNTRMASQIGNQPRLEALLTSAFTLGLTSGVSLGPILDQKVRSATAVPLETMMNAGGLLRLVQGGRMDYTLLSEEEALYLLKQDPKLASGLSVVRLADPPAGGLRCFLYPDGFDALLADRIDIAIDKLRNSARSPATARAKNEEPTEVTPPAPVRP